MPLVKVLQQCDSSTPGCCHTLPAKPVEMNMGVLAHHPYVLHDRVLAIDTLVSAVSFVLHSSVQKCCCCCCLCLCWFCCCWCPTAGALLLLLVLVPSMFPSQHCARHGLCGTLLVQAMTALGIARLARHCTCHMYARSLLPVCFVAVCCCQTRCVWA